MPIVGTFTELAVVGRSGSTRGETRRDMRIQKGET